MNLKLDAIGVVVRDVAASARFYRLLGVPFGEPGPEDDHFEATLPNGLRLMLDSEALAKSIDPDGYGRLAKARAWRSIAEMPRASMRPMRK